MFIKESSTMQFFVFFTKDLRMPSFVCSGNFWSSYLQVRPDGELKPRLSPNSRLKVGQTIHNSFFRRSLLKSAIFQKYFHLFEENGMLLIQRRFLIRSSKSPCLTDLKKTVLFTLQSCKANAQIHSFTFFRFFRFSFFCDRENIFLALFSPGYNAVKHFY